MAKNGDRPIEVIIVDPKRLKDFQERIKNRAGQKEVVAAVDLFGRKTINAIQNISPIRTGRLRNGFDYEVRKSGPDIGQLKIKWAPQGGEPKSLLEWIIGGTGRFGPMKRDITPKHAKALRWKNPRGQWFSKKSVKGMKPNDFIKKALKNLTQEKQILIERIGKITVQKLLGK